LAGLKKSGIKVGGNTLKLKIKKQVGEMMEQRCLAYLSIYGQGLHLMNLSA
jgi:hypothetical protein